MTLIDIAIDTRQPLLYFISEYVTFVIIMLLHLNFVLKMHFSEILSNSFPL